MTDISEAAAADPRSIIDDAPMSSFQWTVVAIMVGLNALDGFDVLSISFASPGITQEWGIDRAALGIVLSMELVGMAVGSLLLGGVADRIGRRRTILGCLVIMTAGMFLAATATNVVTLSAWRVLTGLGIGGMLAATNAAVAEASNARWRNFCVVLMATGYPIGAVAGGSIATQLLAVYDWRSVFIFGGCVTALFIPLVLWRAPESIAFETFRRGPNALGRINRNLARMGHPEVSRLPEMLETQKSSMAELFAPGMARLTILLTFAYLAHIMTFYFLLKWIPNIVAGMGYDASSAGEVLVFANVGGACGAFLLGVLSTRVRLIWLAVGAMILSTAFVTYFGQGQRDLTELSTIAALTGFFTNAGVVALYGLVAQTFPTRVRASATGFIIGIGRGGSAAAPAVAGFLFAAGHGLPLVALLMGLGSLFAAAMLLGLPRRGRIEAPLAAA
jgi:benzoate transport